MLAGSGTLGSASDWQEPWTRWPAPAARGRGKPCHCVRSAAVVTGQLLGISSHPSPFHYPLSNPPLSECRIFISCALCRALSPLDSLSRWAIDLLAVSDIPFCLKTVIEISEDKIAFKVSFKIIATILSSLVFLLRTRFWDRREYQKLLINSSSTKRVF